MKKTKDQLPIANVLFEVDIGLAKIILETNRKKAVSTLHKHGFHTDYILYVGNHINIYYLETNESRR